MDYNSSAIYKLQCTDGYFYIGSSRNVLSKRFSEHKQKSITYPERRVYKHIHENGGWNNCRIVLIESFPCANRQELVKKEDEYIRAQKQNQECLNTMFALETPEQKKERGRLWKLDNLDLIHAQDKVYRENHKPQDALRKKIWFSMNKDRVNEARRRRRAERKIAVINNVVE